MSPTEIAKIILEQESKGLHISDIAQRAISANLVDPSEHEVFVRKLSSALAQNVKNRDPLFKKTRVGGRKKGCYGLFSKVAKAPKARLVPDDLPDTNALFLGKAGEYAIFSELLFRGYNASIMTVDQGVDLIASKGHRFFYLQVKTSRDNNNGFSFTIKKSAFETHLNGGTFYILVARRNISDRHVCDYVILPSSQIQQMILRGSVTGGVSYSIRLTISDTGHFFINKTEDVTAQVNRFSLIV